MKKMLLVLLVLSFSVECRAYPVFQISGSTNESITSVSCSSTTATVVLAARANRKGFAIRNSDVFNVRKSTWAATSQSIGYPITSGGGEISDNIECYTGAIYCISTGTSSATVDIDEKWNSGY